MLVLGRREQETINIYTSDGEIEIIVTRIHDNHVKIGITAPDDEEIVGESWKSNKLAV